MGRLRTSPLLRRTHLHCYELSRLTRSKVWHIPARGVKNLHHLLVVPEGNGGRLWRIATCCTTVAGGRSWPDSEATLADQRVRLLGRSRRARAASTFDCGASSGAVLLLNEPGIRARASAPGCRRNTGRLFRPDRRSRGIADMDRFSSRNDLWRMTNSDGQFALLHKRMQQTLRRAGQSPEKLAGSDAETPMNCGNQNCAVIRRPLLKL